MIRKTFHHLFVAKHRELPFLIFLSFLLTFIVARLWVYLMYIGVLPPMFNYVTVRGEVIHIHHLSYGVVILAVLGFLAIVYPKFVEKWSHTASILYGVGLSLIVDETALWLSLEDDYYHRLSYDGVIITCTILLLVVYFPDFWVWAKKASKKAWTHFKMWRERMKG